MQCLHSLRMSRTLPNEKSSSSRGQPGRHQHSISCARGVPYFKWAARHSKAMSGTETTGTVISRSALVLRKMTCVALKELHKLMSGRWWLIAGKDVSESHAASSGEAYHRGFHREWEQRRRMRLSHLGPERRDVTVYAGRSAHLHGFMGPRSTDGRSLGRRDHVRLWYHCDVEGGPNAGEIPREARHCQ